MSDFSGAAVFDASLCQTWQDTEQGDDSTSAAGDTDIFRGGERTEKVKEKDTGGHEEQRQSGKNPGLTCRVETCQKFREKEGKKKSKKG